MKGKLVLGVILGLVLLTVGAIALACKPDRPPQPTCPAGTIEVSPAVWVDGECSCPTNLTFDGWYWQGWHLKYFSVTFDYGKSSDPNKCHRPTASSLNIPSSLRNEFNREFKEWVDADCTEGYWTDPVCRLPVVGCMDEAALNFNPEAEVDDGTCEYLPPDILGCTDPSALNFNLEANVDDGTCEYPPQAKAANFDIGCREGQKWAFVTPVFDEGIASIALNGVTYFPPTGQAVQLGAGTYPFSVELEDGYVYDGKLEGTIDVAFCPVATPLPKTGW